MGVRVRVRILVFPPAEEHTHHLPTFPARRSSLRRSGDARYAPRTAAELDEGVHHLQAVSRQWSSQQDNSGYACQANLDGEPCRSTSQSPNRTASPIELVGSFLACSLGGKRSSTKAESWRKCSRMRCDSRRRCRRRFDVVVVVFARSRAELRSGYRGTNDGDGRR